MINVEAQLEGNITPTVNLHGEISSTIQYVEPITQEKTVEPSTNMQEITPDEDYTGLSKVTVKAVTNEIDQNIQPDNIKAGIDILGVQGIFEGGYNVEVEESTLIFSNGGEVEEGELII